MILFAKAQRGRYALWGMPVALLLMLSACASPPSSDRPDRGSSSEARVDGGPLMPDLGTGSASLFAPRSDVTEWWGSFGSFILCTADASDLEIQSIALDFTTPPLATRMVVRRVEGESAQSTSPFISSNGKLATNGPTFTRGPGELVPVNSFRVTRGCEEMDPGAFDELLFSFKVKSKVGAYARGFTVNYSNGARMYAAKYDWTMALCPGGAPASGEFQGLC